MKAGSPIKTRSGRRGILITPPGNSIMPLHALIEFPGGVTPWVVKDAILPG